MTDDEGSCPRRGHKGSWSFLGAYILLSHHEQELLKRQSAWSWVERTCWCTKRGLDLIVCAVVLEMIPTGQGQCGEGSHIGIGENVDLSEVDAKQLYLGKALAGYYSVVFLLTKVVYYKTLVVPRLAGS